MSSLNKEADAREYATVIPLEGEHSILDAYDE